MIPEETSALDAIIFAIKKAFPSAASKVGIWRPMIAAGMTYLGWNNHQSNLRHQHHEQQIEEVRAFVQAPPTNGRRIHEIPPPPMPIQSTSLLNRK